MSFRLESTRSSESVPLLVVLFGGALALFTWVSPNHNLPWMSFHSELAMALCAFLVGSWILWRTRDLPSKSPWLAVATAAFALVALIQFAFGLTPFFGDAWLVWLYATGFALAQIVGYRAALKWGIAVVMEPYAWIIVLAGLLSVFMQLYQWQDWGYLEWAVVNIPAGTRPFGNLTQPNHVATLLTMGMLSVATLYDRGRVPIWMATVLTALFGLGIAMSQSRVGLLEVAVAVALLSVCASKLTGHLKTRHALGAAAILVVMVLLWSQIKSATPLAAVGRPTNEMLSAKGARPIHWASMVDAIGRKPLFGYGSYGVSQAQFLVAPDHPTSLESIAHSHNLVLDLLVWDGVPIGLLALLALGWWFWAAFLRVPDSPTLLAFGSVVVVFVHAMVEFPLYYTYFLIPVGVMIGAIGGVAMPSAVIGVPRWTAGMTVVVLGLATALTVVDYFHLEADVSRSSFAHAHIGRNWNDRDYTRMRVLTHFNHFWNFVVEPERRGMTPEQLDEMRAVVWRFPSDANIVRYAAALALNGRPADAHSALSRICKTGPADNCKSAQSLWTALGTRDVEIKNVDWPLASN